MNGNKYRVIARTPIDAPAGYTARQLEVSRRKAGNELYNILFSQKMPAVVDIEERYTEVHDNYYRPEYELQIEITVMPVNHRHITMASADFSDMFYSPKSFVSHVKWNINKLVRKVRRLLKGAK